MGELCRSNAGTKPTNNNTMLEIATVNMLRIEKNSKSLWYAWARPRLTTKALIDENRRQRRPVVRTNRVPVANTDSIVATQQLLWHSETLVATDHRGIEHSDPRLCAFKASGRHQGHDTYSAILADRPRLLAFMIFLKTFLP